MFDEAATNQHGDQDEIKEITEAGTQGATEGQVRVEIAMVDEFAERWRELVPQGKFGGYEATEVFENFRKEYTDRVKGSVYLTQGSVEGSKETSLSEPVELVYANIDPTQVYIVLSPEQPIGATTQTLWQNHQPETLSTIAGQMPEFIQLCQASSSPLAAEYVRAAHHVLLTCELSRQMGTPEFTAHQMDRENWRYLIDVDLSKEKGEVVLRYEERAREILSRPPLEPQYRNIGEALEATLSQEELVVLQLSDQEKGQQTLDHARYMQLLKLIGIRVKLMHEDSSSEGGWKIIDSISAVATNVSPLTRETVVPLKATLAADAMGVTYHETAHAVGAENGYILESPLLQQGLPGNDATEEGFAQLMEMLADQPYGHRRQRLMAARYLAIAMSLKAVSGQDGVVRPKYSIGEIYQELLSHNMTEKDAGLLIWRIQRGTSLQHQGMILDLDDGDQLPIAETYAKDAIYFEGQISVYEYILEAFGFDKKDIDKLYQKKGFQLTRQASVRVVRNILLGKNALDATDQLVTLDEVLRRVETKYQELGLGAVPLAVRDSVTRLYEKIANSNNPDEVSRSSPTELRRELYNLASQAGRDMIISLTQLYRRGKLRLDTPETNPRLWESLPPPDDPKFLQIGDMLRE